MAVTIWELLVIGKAKNTPHGDHFSSGSDPGNGR